MFCGIGSFILTDARRKTSLCLIVIAPNLALPHGFCVKAAAAAAAICPQQSAASRDDIDFVILGGGEQIS